MTIPILKSKLRTPALRSDHISRPQLLERLQTGQARKLTLMIAGAGYGKSTLLAEWAYQQRHLLWYNLDPVDRDPAVFFAHLLDGLAEVWPDFTQATQTILAQPLRLSPEHLAITLLSELEAVRNGEPFLFVLDDFHRLGETPIICSVLNLLLERLPDGVHVAISARERIALSTARLELAGQVNTLSQVDLCFTAREISLLFPTMAALPATVQHLIERSEGWVAGLHLIQQTLASSATAPLLPPAGTSPTVSVYTYLADEVFRQQPPLLQTFLLQTGLLDRFTAADCDTIFERNDSAQWLTYLTEHDLWIVPAAQESDTYRYHHLLTDYLRARVQREANSLPVSAWHRQAGRYYERQERWTEAFEQVMAAEEELWAAELVTRSLTSLRFQGRLDTVLGWLERFSAQIYQERPVLYCCQATLWQDQGRHEQALAACQQAIVLAEQQKDERTLYRAWHLAGNVLHFIGKLDEAQQAFEKAHGYAQSGSAQEQFAAQYGFVFVAVSRGHNRRADALLRQSLELAVALGKPLEAQIKQGIGHVQSLLGNLNEALYWMEQALHLRRTANLLPGILGTLTNLGLVQTRMGKLSAARASLQEVIDRGGQGHHPSVLANALSNLADIDVLQGDFSQAEERYRRSLALKEPLNDTFGLAWTWARLSELRRQQKDFTAALELAQRAVELGDKLGPNERLPLQTTLACAWLAQGEIQLAQDLLHQIIESQRTLTENQYELARCLWLLAHAQQQLKQDAQPAIKEALALVERWNYRFLLVTLTHEFPGVLAEAVATQLQLTLVGYVLHDLGDAALPLLLTLLTAAEATVRNYSLEWLTELALEGAWSVLDQTRHHDPDEGVRRFAQTCLERLHRQPPPPLFITLLGRFTLRRGEQRIEDAVWNGNRQARSLFKFLLVQAGQPVWRDRLITLFWPEPDFTVEAARRNLNQAVHIIRHALEPYLPRGYSSRYLISEGETYCLIVPVGSQSDDQSFETAFDQAQVAQRQHAVEDAIAHYEAAIHLYQGEYLSEERAREWAIDRRQQLFGQIVAALEALIALYLQRQQAGLAVPLAERLLLLDRQRVESYYWQMQAYWAHNRRDQALHSYEQYVAKCGDERATVSAAHIEALYQRILTEY